MSFDSDLLDNVRRVLTGKIIREEVVNFRRKSFVSMGVAIMVASRYQLDENMQVQGRGLGFALDDLLRAGHGTFEDFFHNRNQYGGSGDQYVVVAAELGLYKTLPRKVRARAPIVLDPPSDFLEVVTTHKDNPAIETFVQEAEAGVARLNRWRQRIESSSSQYP